MGKLKQAVKSLIRAIKTKEYIPVANTIHSGKELRGKIVLITWAEV